MDGTIIIVVVYACIIIAVIMYIARNVSSVNINSIPVKSITTVKMSPKL